jgi:(S)-3,5-dihydroxyphenylglycine transaminase
MSLDLSPVTAPVRRSIDAGVLHASVTDPLLESMTFLNEITARFPEAISFAPGRPYEGLFDTASITRQIESYVAHLTASGISPEQVRTMLFQYGRTKGHIHDLVARTIANDEGIVTDPDAIVVTAGAQEGMILVLRALFADPGDVLLVSSPCYIGMTGAARLLGVEVVPVPETAGGLDPEAVREAVRRVTAGGRRVRALYVVPDFANPTGLSLSLDARLALLDVAAGEDFLIIEDNPYGYFTGEQEPRPTLKSLDMDGSVIYVGSFAKTVCPGPRVGFVVADQRVARPGRTGLLADELVKIKSMITVNTSAISQAVIGGALVEADCRLREAAAPMIEFYRRNLAVMCDELERRFPASAQARTGVSWQRPQGGFFTVLSVPFDADEAALERSARDYGVLWTPMSAFYVGADGSRRLRLSCSYLEPGQISEGIARLADFMTAEIR